MFNPFYPFTAQLLQAFVEKGKQYFVRQSFPRGAAPGVEEGKTFLITPYSTFVTAQDHLGAISYDPYRYLYDWNMEVHREKLKKASEGPEGFSIFAAVFRTDWEKGLTDRHRQKIRVYVKGLGWELRGDDLLHTSYELRFGELYICMRFRKRELKIKFEEIESLQ